MKITLSAKLDSPEGIALCMCISNKLNNVDAKIRAGAAQSGTNAGLGLWTQYWRLDEVLRDAAENTRVNKAIKYYVDQED